MVRPGIAWKASSVSYDSSDQEARIAYVAEVRVERLGGPLRAAYLPGEDEPTVYGMHGAIAEHYGMEPGSAPSHASTIDHLVGAALG